MVSLERVGKVLISLNFTGEFAELISRLLLLVETFELVCSEFYLHYDL